MGLTMTPWYIFTAALVCRAGSKVQEASLTCVRMDREYGVGTSPPEIHDDWERRNGKELLLLSLHHGSYIPNQKPATSPYLF